MQLVAAASAPTPLLSIARFSKRTTVKLGKLLDETTATVKEINDNLPPLLAGLGETVDQTNKQLAKIDIITDNVVDMSNNFQSLVAVFSASVGSPLMKLAGYLKNFTGFLGKKK